MRVEPKPYEIYKHFKGNSYQILAIAKDSETLQKQVVYQAMYGSFEIYVRPLDMFMSEVDHKKYPEENARYRFTKVDNTDCKQEEILPNEVEMQKSKGTISEVVHTVDREQSQEQEQNQEMELEIDPLVVEFLDADNCGEKLKILTQLHPKITDGMINMLAAAMDYEVNEGQLEERYDELKRCLITKEKYEKARY